MRLTVLAVAFNLIVIPAIAAQPAPKPGDKPPAVPIGVPKISEIDGESVDLWLAKLKSPDASQRDAAVTILPAFGEPAEKAVPTLLSMMMNDPDPSVRHSCMVILTSYPITKNEKLQQTLIQNLNTMLNSTQTYVRLQTIIAIGRLGPNGAGCIQKLCEYGLRDSSYTVRQAAAATLGVVAYGEGVGPDMRAIQYLLITMTDSALSVRGEAVQSLIMLGRPASPTDLEKEKNSVKLRIDAERDPAQKLWLRVLQMRLDPAVAKTQLPFVAKELTNPKVRVVAAEALGMLGKDSKAHLVDLVKGIKSDDKPENYAFIAMCLWALGQLENEAMPAIEDVRKYLTHKDEGLKAYAKYAEQLITGVKKKN